MVHSRRKRARPARGLLSRRCCVARPARLGRFESPCVQNVSLQALCALSPLVRRAGISRNRQRPDLRLLPQGQPAVVTIGSATISWFMAWTSRSVRGCGILKQRGDCSATACQCSASGSKSREHGHRMPVVQLLPLATACWRWRTDHLPRSMERRRYPDTTVVTDHVRKLSFSFCAVFPRQHHANMRNFGSRP
jgi:hypothetical protein